MHDVETIPLVGIGQETALSIGQLMACTWPKPGVDAVKRAAKTIAIGAGYDGPNELAPRSFVVWDDGRAIAHAMMQPRTLGVEKGDLFVFGLSHVCSDPNRRGEGLGEIVARAAFQLIDDGLARFSLFQTCNKVRSFYQRLGCVLVENRIVNSQAEDPQANPFWDDVVMRYPAGDDWPEGEIDLRGPGY